MRKLRNLVCFVGMFCTVSLMSCDFNEKVTPLMEAAKLGDTKKVKEVLHETGVDVNKKSKYGWTALIFAVSNDHKEVVQLLLNAGANPNVRTKEIPANFETTTDWPSTTALAESVKQRYFSLAKVLLDHGVKVDNDSLALIAGSGNFSLLNDVVRNKDININSTAITPYYFCPLCMASEKGDLDAVKFLMDNGADPNIVHYLHTPLTLAIGVHNLEVVKYLLNNGADPNLEINEVNETAIHVALTGYIEEKQYDNNVKIVKELILHGGQKRRASHGGRDTPLTLLERQLKNLIKSEKEIGDEGREHKKNNSYAEYLILLINLLKADSNLK